MQADQCLIERLEDGGGQALIPLVTLLAVSISHLETVRCRFPITNAERNDIFTYKE